MEIRTTEKKNEREFHIPALGKYHKGRERKQQEKRKRDGGKKRMSGPGKG